MSDFLARALAAPAPAAQPMGNQDMLARILMGTPDPGLAQYPVMEQAAPLAPTMRTGLNNDMWRSARIAEALRNDVNELFAARDPSRNYGTILPISSDPNAEGSTRFDLKGGLTGDLLAMLGAGGRAMRGEEYNPMDITTGMMTVAAPSLASRSSGVLHSAGGSARDGIPANIKQNLKIPDVEIAALRSAMQEKYPDVKLHFGQSRSGHLIVSELVVPSNRRGQGIGTTIMRDLINEADARGLPMALTPDGSFGGNAAKLREFYQRFGFSPNTGRGRDLSVSETMIRPSQARVGEP